jgi:hypothetical protein
VDPQRATKPVFTDESGRRTTVLQWLARGLCGCFVLLTGAVAFTLVTQVPLPGLGGLVAPRSEAQAPRTAPDEAAEGGRDAGATRDSTTAVTSLQAVDRPGDGTSARPAAGSNEAGASGTGATAAQSTPSASPSAAAKPRNAHAAPKKLQPQPRATTDPNPHAATGLTRAKQTDDSASTAPGLTN